MKLLSIQVGLPRDVVVNGRKVSTGIFKESVGDAPVMVRTMNLDGDRQADLTVHGGRDKAVYAYPSEHYPFWRGEYPDMTLAYGMFGENFTTEGLFETEVHIGDRFRIGEAELVVAQPRMPCYKLGIRFGRPDVLNRFLASRRSGIYFAVLREGIVRAGDAIEVVSRDPHAVSVDDIVRLYSLDDDDFETMRRAVQVEALPRTWRGYFQKQLDAADE